MISGSRFFQFGSFDRSSGRKMPASICRARKLPLGKVVADVTGEQLGLQNIVRVVNVVDDLDAGRLSEVGEHALVDVIRPVVDLDGPLLRRSGARQQKRKTRRQEKRGTQPFHASPPRPKPDGR
jgi:hypothetical protein